MSIDIEEIKRLFTDEMGFVDEDVMKLIKEVETLQARIKELDDEVIKAHAQGYEACRKWKKARILIKE